MKVTHAWCRENFAGAPNYVLWSAPYLDERSPCVVVWREDFDRLRDQRDRMVLDIYAETCAIYASQYDHGTAAKIANKEMAERFGLRIVDGKVEEIEG